MALWDKTRREMFFRIFAAFGNYLPGWQGRVGKLFELSLLQVDFL
jgi:hypothetical protein